MKGLCSGRPVATLRRPRPAAMRLLAPLLLLAVVALAAYAPTPAPPASAPAPADSTEWVNLQVLPDSISHDELIGVMRGFTAALGVRCDHCHAPGPEGHPDFPSEANPHKDVARGMMRMTWQVNREILPAIDGLHGEPTVTCYTCHRGAPEPATMAPPRDGPPAPPAGEAPEHEHGDHDHDGHEHGDG